MQERMKVGPSKFSPGGNVHFGTYENGVIAISVFADDGERQYVATVNMPMEPDDPKTEVWIKGWGENEGVAGALVVAGIITLTAQTQRSGNVSALHARLTPAALEQLAREMQG